MSPQYSVWSAWYTIHTGLSLDIIDDMQDNIGSRGEAICYMLLTRPYPGRDILFRPHFLGDKWPSVDFYVELIGVSDITPFFFVQVKSTREGYTQRERRLKVQADTSAILKLTSHPAPTYIIGIDDALEMGYIISANGEWLTSMASLNTEFPLDDSNRLLLWNEVRNFWGTLVNPKLTSAFRDSIWR